MPRGMIGLLPAALLACSEPEAPDLAVRGAHALARLQAADGSWRSSAYADLKQGPALTSLAFFTWSRLPEETRRPHAEAIRRAWNFLAQRLTSEGQVGEEYPNFTTAFTLRAVLVLKPEGGEEAARRMAGYLERAQCVESNGWEPQEPGYGGWGLGGSASGKKEKIRLDVSTSRHVLEALSEAGRIADVREAARRFIGSCQNEDGGFCYSRANPHQNKAGELPSARTGFRSYGTATADGLLALRALGEDPGSAPIRAAREWLEKNFTAQAAPGFEPAPRDPWDRGLLFYYLESASAALKSSGSAAAWRGPFLERLKALQAPDGSWSSAQSIMKENEPAVATCFALLAWAAAR